MSIDTIRAGLEQIEKRAAELYINDICDAAHEALLDLDELKIEIECGLPVGVIAKARAALAEETA
jgi:hypothetical protein